MDVCGAEEWCLLIEGEFYRLCLLATVCVCVCVVSHPDLITRSGSGYETSEWVHVYVCRGLWVLMCACVCVCVCTSPLRGCQWTEDTVIAECTT